MAEVFGLIAAGRSPSQFVQVGEREFLCEIGDAANVNHVVVFMTGLHNFPDGMGCSALIASVYVRWPSPDNQDAGWHYLGFVCNAKPSVIFKIAQVNHIFSKLSSENSAISTFNGSSEKVFRNTL
ncbi:unnamed protein product [Strongylus vulgaris]|uniref:Hikeshi-like N-terminal domain-containing protein n=1 Tax=Strongylus vulgaris TaxID=40348 RepID=A0A3P7K642_STRVU|nr:unnamed protein product [Strongylus vulgaris]